jgi:hypothetical protein
MKDTGGPAFPTMLYEHGGESDGMTLRDYFAAKAMQGLLASTKTNSAQVIAKDAYIIADAMLAERNKP